MQLNGCVDQFEVDVAFYIEVKATDLSGYTKVSFVGGCFPCFVNPFPALFVCQFSPLLGVGGEVLPHCFLIFGVCVGRNNLATDNQMPGGV